MSNRGNPQNLIPVKPGEVRNKWGRAGKDGLGGRTTKSLLELLKEKVNEIDEETGKSIAELIIDQGLRQAKRGDLKFIELVFDRLEGKPKQQIDQTVNGSGLGVVILPNKNTQEEVEIENTEGK